MLLRILDTNKHPVGILERAKDIKISRKLEMDDRDLSFSTSNYELDKAHIVTEGYVETPDDRYVIKEVNKTSDGASASVYCQLDIEGLDGKKYGRIVTTSSTCLEACGIALAGTMWTPVYANGVPNSIQRKQRSIKATDASPYDVLKQIKDTYLVEFKLDSKRKYVTICERLGTRKGTFFTNDLNLKSLSVNITSHDFYTEIEPYGKDGLSIREVHPEGRIYVSNYAYSNKHRRFVWTDERYTVAEHLYEDAVAKLADMAVPSITYTAQVIDLAKIAPDKYEFLSVSLGDIVTVIDSETGTNINHRVTEMTEYPEEPEKNTLTFASNKKTFEQMNQRFKETSDTVNNITTDSGTVNGRRVENLSGSQINDLGDVVADTIQAQVGSFDELYANKATFDQLSATVADITKLYVGDMEALHAYIEQLDAGTINADKAYITELQAETASFQVAYAEKFSAIEATIGELTAGKIDAALINVENLNAAYADIKTLLAGSAVSGDLTTIVLNASNATIDNGFIKDLVAQNVTVADLLAGVISTNKFKIMSDSGNLKIEDNTILIKDSNDRPRIQIGLDGSSNYSFIVYDSEGKGQLFNAQGITESGIADGLIKDAKVAGDANIQASKLDIASLFSTMNESGYTLKGTKIYLDENRQTLDVAFTSINNYISQLKDDVDKAKEDILTNAQHVATFEQSMNGLKENITDTESKLYGVIRGNLLFQVDWVDNDKTSQEADDGSVTLNAHVYEVDPETRGRREVTSRYKDEYFSWTVRDETTKKDKLVGTGKEITLLKNVVGMDGNVDAWFYPYNDSVPRALSIDGTSALTTRKKNVLTTYVSE